ncbi:site-specific integrase [uncultured Thomasclavelia sp.]|uniref:tyrosine-type recombinase/integrase n=1 Tax=uncultured Thomasclavelia sp. TaxID=3025759 RepID=UPI002613DF9F|nr:site-specific integrase [uncultured Thomasclavelia sp.]
MAQYKKRKDGRYITSLTLDGKKYYLYGNTIKELDRKKIEMISKYEQGKSLKSNNVRFKDYKWIWYETKKPMISVKSQQSYKSILNNHFTLIDYKKVSEIKKTDIQLIVSELIDTPNTANKVYMTVNQIMESAIDDDIIVKNPCRRIKKPKIIKKEKRILTNEEFYLTDVADFNDRERMFVIMSKYCGLRPEETRALTKQDFIINNDHGYVVIDKTVVYVSNTPIFQKFTKNDSSKREVPLFDNTIPFINFYLTTLESDKLFTNLTGNDEYLTYQGYKWLIRKIVDKIRIKALELDIEFDPDGFTPYVFRHTYATLLYYSGIRLKDAEYYMGHSDSKMLNDVYIHLDKQKLRNNDVIASYLNNKIIDNEKKFKKAT